jgi:hypothetical protein
MKVATIGVMGAALAVSTVGLSGSTLNHHPAAAHAPAAKTAPTPAPSR